MKLSVINFLIALKNASISKKNFAIVKTSEQVIKLLHYLYEESFILSFNSLTKKNQIKIFFKKEISINFFNNLKIMATSSYGSYIQFNDLCKLISQYRILIISTDKGLLTGDICKKYGKGGRLLFIC